MQRPGVAGFAAQRALKLELQDVAPGNSACTARSRARDISRPDRSRLSLRATGGAMP